MLDVFVSMLDASSLMLLCRFLMMGCGFCFGAADRIFLSLFESRVPSLASALAIALLINSGRSAVTTVQNGQIS